MKPDIDKIQQHIDEIKNIAVHKGIPFCLSVEDKCLKLVKHLDTEAGQTDLAAIAGGLTTSSIALTAFAPAELSSPMLTLTIVIIAGSALASVIGKDGPAIVAKAMHRVNSFIDKSVSNSEPVSIHAQSKKSESLLKILTKVNLAENIAPTVISVMNGKSKI